ncbi:hypothetical protein QUF80_02580 [Desulfococcaceae bacterium HSG8]|nr:hypothetical protein [Desulfococcaceae bacterium HSG8]
MIFVSTSNLLLDHPPAPDELTNPAVVWLGFVNPIISDLIGSIHREFKMVKPNPRFL